MTNSSDFQLAKQVALAYSEDPSSFSLLDFCIANDISSEELHTRFPSQESLFAHFYESLPEYLVDQCRLIDGWDNFSLSEKLTMLIHSSFDEFEEVRIFVEKTFRDTVKYPKSDNSVKEKTVALIKTMHSEDPKTSSYLMMIHFDFVYEFYFTEYCHLVSYWLKDSSEGKEKTFALVDKLTGFMEEVVYNNVLDRGVDLARFFFDNNIIKLPFNINSWFR